ncbi:glycosyltransferase [Vibrio breoganii]
MKNNDLVTVYIPTHNRLELLKRALASLENQTYKNIEIIVVNDGSTDGTKEYLNEITKNGQYIKAFHNDKAKGACYSRNVAIENSNGKFITGLDDDDYFLPDRVEEFIRHSHLLDSYSCLSSAIVQFANNIELKIHFGDKGLVNKDSLKNSNSIGNQVFTFTERFKSLRGFDDDLKSCQDYDMWIRLVLKYGNAYNLGLKNYYMDVSSENGRISTSKKRAYGMANFAEKHQDFLDRTRYIKLKILSSVILNQTLGLKLILSHPFYYAYCVFQTKL